MYFANINEDCVKVYHNTIKSNLNILLTDILNNTLFYVETIIENRLYRIIPLFNCDTIVSTNSNDLVLDNRCIICEYDENTVLNFNTNETVNDFDFNFESRFVHENYFMDFIFYDSITLAKLSNVEMNIKHFSEGNNLILSEDFVSNDRGVIIYKVPDLENRVKTVFTFKYNNIVKTLE